MTIVEQFVSTQISSIGCGNRPNTQKREMGGSQQNKRSPGVRFLIGFGITIAVIFVLLLTLGVIQFVSNG